MINQADYVVDLFRPGDAEGVVSLYRAIYGDDYPVKSVYDSAELIRQSSGEAYRTVARNADGEVVGHMALYRSSPPNPELYEVGQMMVRQDYRQSDISVSMTKYVLAEIPKRYGLEQLWSEAVCNHLVTQRFAVQARFPATALEIDLMPAESYVKAFTKGIENTGRVSMLVCFKAYSTKRQTVFLPRVYEEALRYIYAGLEAEYSFVTGAEAPADGSVSQGRTDVFTGAGVARITLFAVGGDFSAFIGQAEKQARNAQAVVLQVFLPLSSCIDKAVLFLRQNGYFLGGVLPRWFGGDGLLMQKLLVSPNWDGIKLYSKPARRLLEFVKDDWREVAAFNDIAD